MFNWRYRKKRYVTCWTNSLHWTYCITYSGQSRPQGNPSNGVNTTLGTQAGNGSDKSKRQKEHNEWWKQLEESRKISKCSKKHQKNKSVRWHQWKDNKTWDIPTKEVLRWFDSSSVLRIGYQTIHIYCWKICYYGTHCDQGSMLLPSI